MEFEQFKKELGEVDLGKLTMGYLAVGNSICDLLELALTGGVTYLTLEDLFEEYQMGDGSVQQYKDNELSWYMDAYEYLKDSNNRCIYG